MLPARSAFRPETVVSLLPRISILERLNAESLVLRLVGEELAIVHGDLRLRPWMWVNPFARCCPPRQWEP